jgi:hypothetical protein
VFGGLNRLLVATAVAGVALAAVLAGPTVALACNNSTSATNVYKECLPSGGGGNPSTGTKSRSGSGNGGSSTVPISGAAKKAVKHAGKDSRALALVESTRPRDALRPNPTSSIATEPSAVGSAFDLGSGPAAFLIALAGGAVLLLGGSGLHVWRHRRP